MEVSEARVLRKMVNKYLKKRTDMLHETTLILNRYLNEWRHNREQGMNTLTGLEKTVVRILRDKINLYEREYEKIK